MPCKVITQNVKHSSRLTSAVEQSKTCLRYFGVFIMRRKNDQLLAIFATIIAYTGIDVNMALHGISLYNGSI